MKTQCRKKKLACLDVNTNMSCKLVKGWRKLNIIHFIDFMINDSCSLEFLICVDTFDYIKSIFMVKGM